jgi:bifunctional non-homologous end joining protein LigD
MPDPKEIIEVCGRKVSISNPGKIYFPQHGITKADVVRYYLTVAGGALRGVAGRPMVLKRYVNGAAGEAFFQKRAPASRPAWIETVELRFPSGRSAEEVVVTDAAGLAWVANLGCIDLNPHPVRVGDLDHPDELRVDLDPVPGVPYQQILDVAMVARDTMADFGLTGWPKTSGSRGFHHLRQNRAALDVHRGPFVRGRAREGDRAPGTGARHRPLVERGAAGRVR